jgi:hypothetical protein
VFSVNTTINQIEEWNIKEQKETGVFTRMSKTYKYDGYSYNI